MELCTGNDLFERLMQGGIYTERDAAVLMEKLLRAVDYLHNRLVCHRDLKPENFLYADNSPNAEVKIIDFGLSSKFAEDEISMHSIVGTPYYLAPEVLRKNYGKECDIWSLGVLLFVILSGNFPFKGKTHEEVFRKIIRGNYSFNSKYWNNVSREAKNLISNILIVDPS